MRLVFANSTYLLVSHGVSRCKEGWKHFHAFQQSLVEILEEISIGEASVPVLHNVTSVHDLSKNVSQIIPLNRHVTFIRLSFDA